MRAINRRIAPWGSLLIALSLVTLTACGKPKAEETPTPGVEAIFTAAYQTFEAQQATELALTPPTPLASPTLFPTLPPPSPVSTISFGTATGSTGGAGCNNSTYVKDVTIPDNTVVDAGAKFDKTWELLNSGTCQWTTSYKLAFRDGDQMGGADTNLAVAVGSGSVADLTVSMTAPTTAGTYKGNWQLQNDQGVFFGNLIYVQIKVGAGPASTLSSADMTGTATALGTP
jgi:Ig-like domain from next to BRCA1 gene